MHSCRRQEEAEHAPERSRGMAATSQGQVVGRDCGRTFRRQGDLKRHKCLQERSKPVEEQSSSVQCPIYIYIGYNTLRVLYQI